LVGGEWPGGDEVPYHPAVRAYGSVLGSAECRNFATKRNNIAHGVVDMRFSDPPKLKLGYWLVPSLYTSKKNPLKGPNAYAYTSAEIDYFIKEFDRLWVETGVLISDISRDQYASS
jgi:hypothetical protein